MRRQETANREIRREEDNGDMTSHNSTNKPACFTQLNSTALVPSGECQEAADAKHCVSCHNSRYLHSFGSVATQTSPSPFEDWRRSEDEFSKERC